MLHLHLQSYRNRLMVEPKSRSIRSLQNWHEMFATKCIGTISWQDSWSKVLHII